MATYRIPFNRPSLSGDELDYMRQAVDNGYISGSGVFTARCQQLLEEMTGAGKALLTTSCTHALEMAALLLDIGPDDEFIVPSFTFVSTANAFVLRGAKPVFADVRPDTLNLDESQLEPLITERTKAIVPVHYAGVGCEMDTIMRVVDKYDISVIEDNAHGLGGRYKEHQLGRMGELATLSFHETKNFSCGEGGALLINNVQFIERAEIIRDKGTNRSRFLRGEVDKYTWVDVGSSYVLSDLLAAYLLAQLENAPTILAKRRAIWEFYYEALYEWAQQQNVRLPHVPLECEPAYHMFYLILPSLEAREHLSAHLRAHSILSVFHYVPLHLSPMGRQCGGYDGQCPVTERVSDCLLRLPFYNDITEAELSDVVQTIKSCRLS